MQIIDLHTEDGSDADSDSDPYHLEKIKWQTTVKQGDTKGQITPLIEKKDKQNIFPEGTKPTRR